MKLYVGVTDYDWLTILKSAKCEEVNFWKPGASTNFKLPSSEFLHWHNDHIYLG